AYLDAAIKNSKGELTDQVTPDPPAPPPPPPAPPSAPQQATPQEHQDAGIVCENVESVLPPNTIRARKIILAAAKDKDKDKEGSVLVIPDDKDKTKGDKLKTGEGAVFEVRLHHS